jgi:rhodanese-related sulfurtransferase
MSEASQVTQFGTAAPEAAAEYFRKHLLFTTDPADVAGDLQNGSREILVIDARSAEWYAKSHIPGAISFPHQTMNDESVKALPRDRVLVVYCDGIGCNASTKGAFKLAALGFRVKEMLGGLDWWIRDGHAVATGEAETVEEAVAIRCGC